MPSIDWLRTSTNVQNMLLTAKHNPQSITTTEGVVLNEMLFAEESEGFGLVEGVGLGVGEELVVEIEAEVEVEDAEVEPPVVP